jgi:hypothetical protein
MMPVTVPWSTTPTTSQREASIAETTASKVSSPRTQRTASPWMQREETMSSEQHFDSKTLWKRLRRVKRASEAASAHTCLGSPYPRISTLLLASSTLSISNEYSDKAISDASAEDAILSAFVARKMDSASKSVRRDSRAAKLFWNRMPELPSLDKSISTGYKNKRPNGHFESGELKKKTSGLQV